MNQAMFEVRVARMKVEALDICSFELVRANAEALPAFSAGAHIDVQGPTGLVRQYSLCNDAKQTSHYQIGVLRDPKSRGGSVAMHDGTHLFVCGPTGFLEFVRESARKQGWQDSHVHYEYFGAQVVHSDADAAFDVKVVSTGKVYRIAADTSVTSALAEQGVEIPVSCEQGVCGTCLTRVLEGEPDHRDQFPLDDERAANDQFTPCCSRARSSLLVLDL